MFVASERDDAQIRAFLPDVLAHSRAHGQLVDVRSPMEYTGEKINRKDTKRRADTAEFNYLFTLDSYWTIDGSVGGSGAEFINHCCDANLEARIVSNHILYFTLRDIRKGEELSIDYRFSADVERYDCKCGFPNCRGTINLIKPKRERKPVKKKKK